MIIIIIIIIIHYHYYFIIINYTYIDTNASLFILHFSLLYQIFERKIKS